MRRLALWGAALVSLGLVACGPDGADEADAQVGEARTGYPEGPYGVDRGAVMRDHTFKTPADEPFSLSEDIYQAGHKVLLLATAAEWCTACREEASKLQSLSDTYGARGLNVLVTLFEDADGDPVTPQHAQRWIDLYKLKYDVVADADFQLQAYYDPSATPLIMVVDARTMKIAYKNTGFQEGDVRSVVEALLR